MQNIEKPFDPLRNPAHPQPPCQGACCRLSGIALAASLTLLATDARALLNDTMELYAAETLTHDSNVFRLSDAANANAILGSSQRSDIVSRTEFGLNFNLPVSRQSFVASLNSNRTHFGHYSDLDFTGRNARAAWLWQAGDRLNGELGYSETKTLASFSDVQSRIVNPLLTQRSVASANYLVTPRWQLQAALTQTDRKNDNPTRRQNDSELRDLDLGINYISPAANKISLTVHQTDGRMPNDQLVLGNLLGNDYTQRGVGLAADWNVSAKSHLKARLDHVRRNYDVAEQRNWSGTLGQVTYDWKISEPLTLSARAQRDISQTEDIQTYFVLLKGISLRPTLTLSSKTRISANWERSIRDYLGDVTTVVGNAPMRSDTVQALGATMTYEPIPKLTLSFTVQREKRSSNAALADYEVNVMYLSARYAF